MLPIRKILTGLAIAATITTASTIINISPIIAAEVSLNEILAGKTVPNSIKLKDLTPEWRGLSTNGQFELGNTFQTIFAAFGGGAFTASYYTKGQTISLGSETYLIAYSLQEQPEKIAADTNLGLSLLNLKTIGSLTNIRSFNVSTETVLLEKQLQGTRAMFPPTKPVQPDVKTPTATPAPVAKPTRPRRRK
jgi:hypothetical protein